MPHVDGNAAAPDHATASTQPALHHGDHNHLLDIRRPRSAGRLDAVIVPTFRAADALRDSIPLTRGLGVPMVALCSGQAQAERAVMLGRDMAANVVAIDLHETRPRIPAFHSDEVLSRAGFAATSDLSLKRNLGLLISRLVGWDRVLFLDDDIHGVRAEDLRGAAAWLDDSHYRAVGLENRGYPDNSVVCHAYRAIGAEQNSFIGGGAMIVNPLRTRSFFPNVYNEDWFFLLGDGVPFRAAVSGSMVQRAYDPFATSRRAANEEFGDTLAEGLFWLLDLDRDPAASDAAFWGAFLFRRRALLDHVLGLIDERVTDQHRAGPIKAALKAARGRSSDISAKLCHDFILAWSEDLRRWGRFLDGLPAIRTLDKALSELGISHVARQS